MSTKPIAEAGRSSGLQVSTRSALKKRKRTGGRSKPCGILF
jgi:hypothetical protein